MKKIGKKSLAILLAMTLLMGCGQQEEKEEVADNTLTYKQLKDVDVTEYVTVGDYEKMTVQGGEKPVVSDADVDAYLENVRNLNENFMLKEGTVEEGSIVNIDYKGFIDGEQFDGGTASSKMLKIGSHQYIDGFESGLVGKQVGETVDLSLTFPENYGSTDLAGKDVVFTVTINYILAEITDENINALDNGYTSAETYITDTKNMLQDYVSYQYNMKLHSDMATAIVQGSTFKNIPDSLVESFRAELKAAMEDRAKDDGVTIAQYMAQNYGVPETGIESSFDQMAEQVAKEGLVMQAIANEKKLTVSDEELDASIEDGMERTGIATKEDYYKSYGDREDIRINLMDNKVYTYLEDHMNIVNN